MWALPSRDCGATATSELGEPLRSGPAEAAEDIPGLAACPVPGDGPRAGHRDLGARRIAGPGPGCHRGAGTGPDVIGLAPVVQPQSAFAGLRLLAGDGRQGPWHGRGPQAVPGSEKRLRAGQPWLLYRCRAGEPSSCRRLRDCAGEHRVVALGNSRRATDESAGVGRNPDQAPSCGRVASPGRGPVRIACSRPRLRTAQDRRGGRDHAREDPQDSPQEGPAGATGDPASRPLRNRVHHRSAHAVPAPALLEWYRLRWQVKLVCKRFKSLEQRGHLPKGDEDSARA